MSARKTRALLRGLGAAALGMAVSAALPAPMQEGQPQTWTAAVEDVATRYDLRIVSFLPKYSLPPFEPPEATLDAAGAVKALAADAYGVALRAGPDVWIISPQYTPHEPPASMWAGSDLDPFRTSILLIPFLLREQAAEPNSLPLSQLPPEARAALPTVRDERDREPDAVSVLPGGFVRVEYRGHAVLATRDVFYYARALRKHPGQNRKEPRADKYHGLAQIDALLGARAQQPAHDTWKDWMSPIKVDRPLRTLKQVVAALNASRLPKRVSLDSHLGQEGALVTPGTYATGELLWLVRDACCVTLEEGADAVTMTWDRSCMDRLWQIPHDWQERRYWGMAFHPFLSHAELQELAKPFTLRDLMDFRVISWADATAEQRAFVLRLLAEHGEHPRPEQECYLVLFLSPRFDLYLTREGRLVGGVGPDGYLAQPQVRLGPR